MRLLAFLSDAFGGRGGIAKFNRDLLTALCSHPACAEVVALPRLHSEAVHAEEEHGALPPALTYRTEAAQGKSAYLGSTIRLLLRDRRFGGVVCGHINLLPLAYAAARLAGAPLLLITHGVEAWQPTGRLVTDALARRLDVLVSVSDFTRQRMLGWAGPPAMESAVIPNCIDASRYGPGPKRADLLERYHLEGRTVLLTLGRMAQSERYKGFDETLDVLPALAHAFPDLAYLIAGDGDDRPRLEQKVRTLGLEDRVVFAGYVPEDEKADHFRLADAFVMPGRGEGFGIVYLEALACGIPVVASSADASQEAVRGGQLGIVVDPDDPIGLKAGIQQALATRRGVPEGLDYFSHERFAERWHALLDRLLRGESSSQRPAPARPLVAH